MAGRGVAGPARCAAQARQPTAPAPPARRTTLTCEPRLRHDAARLSLAMCRSVGPTSVEVLEGRAEERYAVDVGARASRAPALSRRSTDQSTGLSL